MTHLYSGTFYGVSCEISEDGIMTLGRKGETQVLNKEKYPLDNALYDEFTFGKIQVKEIRTEGKIELEGDVSSLFCFSILKYGNYDDYGDGYYEDNDIDNHENNYFNNEPFCYCEKADLSSFDTSKVTNMNSMFAEMKALKQLDVSSFDTSNVKDMNSMFFWCENLRELDLSTFDTSKVENMYSMFRRCRNLREVNVSSFNTENVKDMSYMYKDCHNLKSLDMLNFSTAGLDDAREIWASCPKLRDVKVSNFNVPALGSFYETFYECGLSQSKIDDIYNSYYNTFESIVGFNIEGEDNLFDDLANMKPLKGETAVRIYNDKVPIYMFVKDDYIEHVGLNYIEEHKELEQYDVKVPKSVKNLAVFKDGKYGLMSVDKLLEIYNDSLYYLKSYNAANTDVTLDSGGESDDKVLE